MPKALGLRPQVGPTSGTQALPKRPGAAVRTGRASFTHDVLGVLESAPPPPPFLAQELETPSAGSADPPEAARPQGGLQAQEGPRRHDWHWQAGRWLCTACLATSRSGVPPRLGKCAGMSANLARLVRDPRKHTLQVATFADGFGMVVVCSRCGHYASSNRPSPLHKKDCLAVGGQQAFASPGAKSAYERIASGRHPKHAKGEAKVLDPCMSLDVLLRAGQEPRVAGQEPRGKPP